jgi:hypothetical protein
LGLGRGEISTKASFYASSTRHTYNENGNKVSFMFNGKSVVTGVNFEILYGLTDRLTVYAAVPYIDYDLSDDAVKGIGSGFGDVVVSGRLRMFTKPLESHLELGLKFPTADSRDPSLVVVGEGQYDVDVSLLLAAPFTGRASWVTGQLGYRFRAEDTDRSWKPGNEFLYRIEGGYKAPGPFSFSLALSGFRGGRQESFDLVIEDTQRELVSLVPAISYGFKSNWAVRVDYSVPVDGRNYVAGGLFGAALVFSSSDPGSGTAKNHVPAVRGISCCRTR